MLVEAASDWDLSQRLPVKREPTKVPREWHGRNPGHSWPGGCQGPAIPRLGGSTAKGPQAVLSHITKVCAAPVEGGDNDQGLDRESPPKLRPRPYVHHAHRGMGLVKARSRSHQLRRI